LLRIDRLAKNPSVNRGNMVAELTTMQSIGVTGATQSHGRLNEKKQEKAPGKPGGKRRLELFVENRYI